MSALLLFSFLTGNWDSDLSNAIRKDTTCGILRTAMQGITLASDARTQAAATIGIFFFGGDKEAHAARLATLAWAGAGVLTTLLKAATYRPRPDNSQTSRWDSSLPSGHVSSYFALATVYAAKYRKLAAPLYLIGAGVAYSRVYFAKHYPSDVLVGAALGAGIGWLTLRLEPQLRRIPFFR